MKKKIIHDYLRKNRWFLCLCNKFKFTYESDNRLLTKMYEIGLTLGPVIDANNSTPSRNLYATSSSASRGHSRNQFVVVAFISAGYWRMRFLIIAKTWFNYVIVQEYRPKFRREISVYTFEVQSTLLLTSDYCVIIIVPVLKGKGTGDCTDIKGTCQLYVSGWGYNGSLLCNCLGRRVTSYQV